jgi:hypothetical protein
MYFRQSLAILQALDVGPRPRPPGGARAASGYNSAGSGYPANPEAREDALMRKSVMSGSLPAPAQNVEAIVYTFQQILNLISSLFTVIGQMISAFTSWFGA